MDNLIQIQNLIYEIRGYKVMLDRDLAILYEVPVKSLNQAVKRNLDRFPKDFMFRLTDEEWSILRSQIVTANISKVRYTPFAFTQYGALMLANILTSPKAINMSINIIRAFEQLRQAALENKDLNRRLTELEHLFVQHCKDNSLDNQELLQAINLLMDRTKPATVGFVKNKK